MQTHDETMLRRFRTKERVMELGSDELEKLRLTGERGDAYAQYGYGRWLYFCNPSDDAMKKAEELFFATKDFIPDSLAAYAQMLRYGETTVTHSAIMDIERSEQLNNEAIKRGSTLAATQQARHRIFGNFCESEPQQVATEIEMRLSDYPDSDPLWYLLLAYAYEEAGRQEDAIRLYEEAIEHGEVEAYFYLAFTYQRRGNMALYEALMEEGCEKGCTTCLIYQSDTADDDFDTLPKNQQQLLHQQLDERLYRGLKLGEGLCAYYLWMHHYYGGLGYTADREKAFAYLKRGIQLASTPCIIQMATEAESGHLPNSMRLSATDIAELWLKAARYAPYDEEVMLTLQRVSDPVFLLRHKEELEHYWLSRFDEDEDDGRFDAWT